MLKHIDILSLFPDSLKPYLQSSLLGKAIEQELVQVGLHDLRSYSEDKHRRVDDDTYGGGEGMVLKPEPLVKAIESLRSGYQKGRVIYLSPQGRRMDQALVRELGAYQEILLVCGRYEGIDQRVLDSWIDEEVSLGDFVLFGGELPALALVEALVRLIPGAVGKAGSLTEESFEDGLLEYPHYTRPEVFQGHKVPEILLQGNHAQIRQWRREQALKNTFQKRPDLLAKLSLSEADRAILKKWGYS